MAFLIEISFSMLLVTIHDSLELFAFGVVLVVAGSLFRSFLSRANSETTDGELSEKGFRIINR